MDVERSSAKYRSLTQKDEEVNDQTFILGSFTFDSLLDQEVIAEGKEGIVIDTDNNHIFVEFMIEEEGKQEGQKQLKTLVKKIRREDFEHPSAKSSTKKKIYTEPVVEKLYGLSVVNVAQVCCGGLGHRLLLSEEGLVWSVRSKSTRKIRLLFPS